MPETFFHALQRQWNRRLPFVVYRKPDERILRAFLQKDSALHILSGYTESGFVLAPFDTAEPAVVIPAEVSDQLILEHYQDADISFGSLSIDIHVRSASSDREKYLQLVEKSIQAIKRGQFTKVALSRKELIACGEMNPIVVFKKLILTYPSAFCYTWFHPKIGCWAGATPELLLAVTGNRFQTMALAGTQPFYDTTEVVWGEKEREEQRWVTDFILERIKTQVHRIQRDPVKTVRAGNLLHLQTSITGFLDFETFNFGQLLSALHPTPAVCGFPKEEALQFILKKEGYRRSFYTGFLGEFQLEKPDFQLSQAAFYVNLRCMQLQNGHAVLYAGGGITERSEPEAEWEETVSKMQTILKALQK